MFSVKTLGLDVASALLSLWLCALGALACGEPAQAPQLGGETNWLAWCASDAECREGQCVCGVCTEACDASASSCSGGPPRSSCFASGSIGHAALCDAADTGGICLPGCSLSADCGPGLSCAVGACVPETALPSGDALGVVDPAEALASAPAAYALFSDGWLPLELPEPDDYATTCADPARCPSLEALLSADACFEVRHGCGLVHLNARWPSELGSRHFWYDAYGALPVAVYETADLRFASQRSIDCASIDVACSTCGQPATAFSPYGATDIACEDIPGALPEPPVPPPATAGCQCEPDADGSARVSLECFCGLYGCPTQAEFLAGCQPELETPSSFQTVARDACGQTWFVTADYRGQRYAFDPVSLELIGALAFSPGPVTSPCGTHRVSAGAALDCEVSEQCRCSTAGSPESCSDAAWYSEL